MNLTVCIRNLITQLTVLIGGIPNLLIGFIDTHLLAATTSIIALPEVIYYPTQVYSLHSGPRLGLTSAVPDSDHRAKPLFVLVAPSLFLEAEFAPWPVESHFRCHTHQSRP